MSLASRDIARTAAGAIFDVIVIVNIDACFFVCSAFLRRRPRFSFRFGWVRCDSVRFSLPSRQSGCLALDWRDDWWRKCNRHRLHEPAWPEQLLPVWVLECAKQWLSVLQAAWCGGLRSGCRAVRMLTFNCVANWPIFALCRLLTNDKPQWEIVVHI